MWRHSLLITTSVDFAVHPRSTLHGFSSGMRRRPRIRCCRLHASSDGCRDAAMARGGEALLLVARRAAWSMREGALRCQRNREAGGTAGPRIFGSQRLQPRNADCPRRGRAARPRIRAHYVECLDETECVPVSCRRVRTTKGAVRAMSARLAPEDLAVIELCGEVAASRTPARRASSIVGDRASLIDRPAGR